MQFAIKEFNWELCKEIRRKEIYDYFFENHRKPITEEAFVSFISTLPRDGIEHASRKYSPSSARAEYRNLKKNFGFFPE